jgi:hypothetical protein
MSSGYNCIKILDLGGMQHILVFSAIYCLDLYMSTNISSWTFMHLMLHALEVKIVSKRTGDRSRIALSTFCSLFFYLKSDYGMPSLIMIK